MKSNSKSFLRLKYRFMLFLLLFALQGSALAASMFWEVKNANSRVFLLGSVHVATPSYYPLADVIESGFKQSDVLVLEINPLSPESQQLMMGMAAQAMYGEGEDLTTHLDSHTLQLLKDTLKQSHLPLEPMLKMKPAMLAVTLSMAKLATLGYTSSNGIDMYFIQKAGTSKPIEELETAQMQMDLLLNMPKAEIFLRYTLEQMDDIEPMMKKLDSAWKSGDTGFIEKLLIDDSENKFPELKQTNEKFLYQRNVNMAKKVARYLDSGKTYFVIVGTAHLVGERGIVNLLKKRGFRPHQY